MKLGYIDTFIDAGAAVSTPTCGPCLGGYMGILAAGERAVSTTNRNFRGRMGHVDSEVYLAFWLRAKGQSAPLTATSAGAWAMWTARFTWQARIRRRQVP